MTYFYYYGKQYATATPADGLRKFATEKKEIFCWKVKDDGSVSNTPSVVSGEMITGITEK